MSNTYGTVNGTYRPAGISQAQQDALAKVMAAPAKPKQTQAEILAAMAKYARRS